jgi:hypothetical protein
MADLRQRLRLEGYQNAERELFGSALRTQLQTLMPKSYRPSMESVRLAADVRLLLQLNS